jgi:hypothetical protein
VQPAVRTLHWLSDGCWWYGCPQERYAAGTKDILQRTFDGEDLKPADIICKDGKLAPQVHTLCSVGVILLRPA